MPGTNGSKGNPASKRMTNPNLKARRQRSWLRGQAKKKRNREANQEAYARNNAMLKERGLTRTKSLHEAENAEGKLISRMRPDSPQRTIRLATVVPTD